MEDLPTFYEINGFIFVHAGIDTLESDWRQTDLSDFLFVTRLSVVLITRASSLSLAIPEQASFAPSNRGGQRLRWSPCHFPDDRVWVSPCERKLGINGGSVFDGVLHGLHLNDDQPDTIITTVTQGGELHKTLLALDGGLLSRPTLAS